MNIFSYLNHNILSFKKSSIFKSSLSTLRSIIRNNKKKSDDLYLFYFYFFFPLKSFNLQKQIKKKITCN